MAIKIGANLAYNGKLPNFERDSFETKVAMKAFDENSINEGHLSYCEEDGNIYQYKHTNTVDATTGRWRLFKTDIVADAALNGASKNPIQNKAVFEALKLKADAAALDKYQLKYNADYVAKADLSELPITKGVLDLNGHSINTSFINNDGELTIQNGTILTIGEINDTLNIINCTIKDHYVRTPSYCQITFNNSSIEGLVTADDIHCCIFNSNVGSLGCDCKQIDIYNSIVGELTCSQDGYNNVVINNSYIATISYSPTSQPRNDGWIYLYNCVFEVLDLDGYPRNIDVQLCSCCDFNNDVTYVNGYYDNTDGLRERAYTTEIQKDNDLAPTADAVYNALGAYQPKYKADYVATKDFNYSELPADVHVVDLNGYTMSINVDPAGIHIHNGNILVNGANVTFDGQSLYNVSIDTDGTTSYTIIDTSFYNCDVYRATVISWGAEFYHCVVGDSNMTVMPFAISSKFYACTFPKEDMTKSYCYSVVINGTLYANPGIKNGKLIELNFESNIANPTIPGNAPSCEAVNAKFANYLTKTDANTTYAKKSDITNIYKFKGTKTNYADLPTTDRVTGDVWNITNADAEHGIKAGDNVAWNGTAWDNLSGTVDLSAYATKDSVAASLAKKVDIRGIPSFNSTEEGKPQIQRIVTINVPTNRYQTGFLGLTLMCRAGKFIHVLITINNDNIPGTVNVVETSIVSYTKELLYYVHDTANSKVMLYYEMDAYDTITAKVTDKDANMNFTWEMDFTPVEALPEGAIQVHNINYNAKNLFYATPKDAAGDPTFRAINITDLPDLSSKYVTKEKAFSKDTASTEPGQVVAGPATTRGNLYLRKLIADDIPDLRSKYQPKYAADYIATEDISTLPITDGVIDLNGNQIDLPNIDLVDGYLTIMNGTVVFNSTTTNLRVKELELSNVTISYSDDANIVLGIQKLECLNVVDTSGLRINFTEGSAIKQATLINSSIRAASLSVTETLNMYNSTCNINGNVKLTAYNSFVGDDGLSLANGSAWYNTQLDIYPYYTSGWTDEAGKMHCGMYFDDTITGDSDYAPQTKAVYNAFQLKADKTQLNDLATKTDFVELRNKVNAMPKTVFITQAAYNALTTKDPNTIYYING